MRKYLSNSFTSLFLILVSTLFGQNSENPRDVEIEMKSERIRLSYVDPSRCAQLLNFYSVNIGDPKKPIDPTQLPVVVAVPETAFHETIPDHEKVFPKTETDPINELLL